MFIIIEEINGRLDAMEWEEDFAEAKVILDSYRESSPKDGPKYQILEIGPPYSKPDELEERRVLALEKIAESVRMIHELMRK